MITLSQTDKEKLTAALTRATGLELITTDVDGVYFVRSGEAMYMVVVAKQNNQVEVDCSCPAGSHDRICKHGAFALKALKEKLEVAEFQAMLEDGAELSANYSQIEAATEAPAPVEEKFTCFKRGCTVEVDERDLFCDDHALELSMIRSELFGD
jgi:hypothetical protein